MAKNETMDQFGKRRWKEETAASAKKGKKPKIWNGPINDPYSRMMDKKGKTYKNMFAKSKSI